MQQFFDVFSPIFNMLMPAYAKKLWNFIFGEFCDLYIQMIIVMSMKYKVTEKEVLQDKLETEIEIIEDLFKDKLTKKIFEDNKIKLSKLISVFTSPADSLNTLFGDLIVGMGDKFNEKSIKCILRIRSDLSKDEKHEILKELKQVNDKLQKKSKSSRNSFGPYFLKLKVSRYLKGLRKRIQEKKEKLKLNTKIK